MENELTIRFEGGVIALSVWLEGLRIRKFQTEGGTLVRHLKNFHITGPLDLAMKAKGFNGTPWKITIEQDGTQIAEYEGNIKNGISLLREEIIIK